MNDKRGTKTPVPDNIVGLLTEEQMLTMRQLANFGWQVAFIRRPLFQEVVVVVTRDHGDEIGVLEPDGKLNLEAGITLRS